ncbi:MAG TPA: DUF2934 domain-containing protein [Polyangia bacterium]|nr:DUF2934 domain-containing protein [Polyangia bacterium]
MKNTGRKTVKGDKVSAPKAVKATSSKITDEAKPVAAKPVAAKPVAMTSATVPKSTSMSGPTHQEIAQRSYELYLARGSIDGQAEDDWARAESELRSR